MSKPVKPQYAHLGGIIESLDRYVEFHCPTGGFLDAVLRNDLKESCARADSQNLYLLFDIVSYLYNEVPWNCWGTPERVNAWLHPVESVGEEKTDDAAS